MAKASTYRNLVAWLLVLLQSAYSVAPAGAQAPVKVYSATAKRAELVKVFAGEVGTREVGGSNRGPKVEAYLATSGNRAGEPWCGAFVAWCYRQVGLKPPAGAGAARNWFPAAHVIYTRGIARTTPRPGDCVGYYYANLGRIGHVGFVEKWGEDFVITVEGNTGAVRGVARDGDGVHRMRRLRTQITFVSTWVPDK